MHKPALWRDDPACGHLVAHPHQTHYCTYIRVPRLLTLQSSQIDHEDEKLAFRMLQAYELWFLVLARDLECVLAELDGPEPDAAELVKLLGRGVEIVKLLARHNELGQSFLLDGLQLTVPLADDRRRTRAAARIADQIERAQVRLADLDRPDVSRMAQELFRRHADWAKDYAALTRALLPTGAGAPSYAQYLQLDVLLDLQEGVKGQWAPKGEAPVALEASEPVSADELMFIVVHQAFELWFDVLLHELDRVAAAFRSEPARLEEAVERLSRVVRAQRLLVDQIHIPATMRPLDFLRFRSEEKTIDGVVHQRGLSPASGTESYQFREIEILAGLKRDEAYEEFLFGNEKMHIRFLTPRGEERLQQPSLRELFIKVLGRRGLQDPVEMVEPPPDMAPDPQLAEVADLLVQFDQFFQLWRVHHLMMVQSMIGRKSGTGFLGPEYLQETVSMGIQGEEERLLETRQARPRFFPELWEIRTKLRAEQ